MTRLFAGFGAAFLGVLIAVNPVLAAQPTPLIETFHATLIDVMKHAKDLKLQGRYDRLQGPLAETFNLPFMIQVASGTKWKGASDDDKAKLIAAFKRVSVGTYAQRFDGYSGETFETIGEQDGPSGSKLVLTRIVRPNKDPVPITYVTRKFGEDWHVVDVIVSNGISELAVRRSEYNGILNDGGPAELVVKLNQKADAILSSAVAN
jgi:phospholipid transport system substrate-binding protein